MLQTPVEASPLARVRVPDPLASKDATGRRYGGDIRIGDLTGDGLVDFVVYRSLAGMKPSFLGAFDLRGEPLWSYESRWNDYPRHAAYIPSVGDLDGDGLDEVVGGHFARDHSGTAIWERYLGDNMDSVLVAPWSEEASGGQAILSAGGRQDGLILLLPRSGVRR